MLLEAFQAAARPGTPALVIHEAENGQHALAMMDATAYDLVLMDVMMPVMDGPTAIRAMRAAGNRTPVVVVTAMPVDAVEGLPPTSVSAILSKPINRKLLRATVWAALGWAT